MNHIARSTVTVSVLLAVTVAALTGCSRPHRTPTSTPAASTAPSASDQDAHSDDGDDGVPGDPSATPADPAAVDAATRVIAAFMTAWARPGVDQQGWHADVARYASPAYAAKLATVDPANVPATQVTAAPVVTAATDTAVVADVGTDAGPVTVTCVRLDGQWLVVNVQPPEPQDTP